MSRNWLHRHWESEVCLVTAENRADLARRAGHLADALEARPEAELADIAFTLAREWNPARSCLAIVATSTDQLARKLRHAATRLADASRRRIHDKSGIYFFEDRLGLQGSCAFLFPGEGAQYSGMLMDVCLHFPEVRQAFETVDRACAREGDGFVPSATLFPRGSGNQTGDDDALWGMAGAVEAVMSADTALLNLFQNLGLRPQAVVGHSSGEFLALECAGIVRYPDEDSRLRNLLNGFRLMKNLADRTDIPEGHLLTVGGTEPAAIERLVTQYGGRIQVAMSNCPHQHVLCVPADCVDAVTQALANEGGLVAPLPFNRPYHTPGFAPALDSIRDYFRGTPLHAPQVDIYSCATAERFPDDPEQILALGVGQWAARVRFQDTIETLHQRGFRVFVELGPRGNLTSFVDDILQDRPHLAVATNRPGRGGIDQINRAVAMLAAHGVPLNPAYLHAHRHSVALDLEHIPASPVNPVPKGTERLARELPRVSCADLVTKELPNGSLTVPSTPATFRASPDTQAHLTRYMLTMQKFLAVQQEMALQFLSRLRTTPGAIPAPSPVPTRTPTPPPELHHPLLGTIISQVPEQTLEAVKTCDIAEEILLIDHTIGTNHVSVQDPTLTGLPVMPLTMTLEILAEAAAALAPGRVVIAIRDVLATRWLTFEDNRLSLQISAQRLPGHHELAFRTLIREASADSGPAAPLRPVLAEATIVLADRYPTPESAPAFHVQDEKPSGWKGQQIYPERLFHGPRFQGVTAISAWGINGARASAVILPRNRHFASNPAPTFTMDPVFLDVMGQVLGLWHSYQSLSGIVVFPFTVKEIRFFAPPLPPGTELSVDLHRTGGSEMTSIANLYAYGPSRDCAVAITGWQDRVFDVTEELHRITQIPEACYFADFLDLPTPLSSRASASVCCISPQIPLDLFETSHQIWKKVLLWVVLSADERAHWRRMEGSETRKMQWLWGRTVAKDAVRRLLLDHFGIRMMAADIVIEADSQGKPCATGTWRKQIPTSIELSIAHSGGVAVAVAVTGSSNGAGVDIEIRREVSPDFLQGAFAPEDQQTLAGLPGATHDWALRLWCAKEATCKRLGSGMRHDARDLRIARVDPATGQVDITLTGPWALLAPRPPDNRISTFTFLRGDGIICASF
jgi:malonyl CoA-acyl carrier protein transacylase/phosphopantetheinyl transferase